MGEAKRRRAAGAAVSWCRDCTLCCSIPEIQSLDKPMYRPCRHLAAMGAGQGCGIFGRPERPPVCVAFRCAYLAAREANAADRHAIPHPSDAGAYFARDPVEPVIALFVDPARPEIWKRGTLPDYLRPLLRQGLRLEIIDRGRQMSISTPALFEEILKRDYVAYAAGEGRPLDFPDYAVVHGG